MRLNIKMSTYAMDILDFQTKMYRAIQNIKHEGTWCDSYNGHDYLLHTLWHISADQVTVFHFNFTKKTSETLPNRIKTLKRSSASHLLALKINISLTLQGKLLIFYCPSLTTLTVVPLTDFPHFFKLFSNT